ncbi:MAG: 2-alkenal reductase [Ignavibacteria bacterium RIFOXYB2_FULL_35_12]|nr:MAG: 2-alkenal reductase [Ignavibacteria bacterium GWA2_36_19]OGU57126.1 MAG: 2-alkenal reductase [Ignavibacteria bacterium GWF2_35_20]OGU83376.1 MAG: 2-alkenal reductase [Ignavibacteria bacterium RBG_16_35_7]OGU83439.1 MAG: 2-alkenal reductase [Ignavibacteria bacterium RIFOXYA2_FULL_35_9]OGU88886.1 MAG: 2-alkenal reductase [Ignavibacteria bacterium RIFOXYA12_FULL_35_25]OGU90616.1 MAG: 2-alkenal reductase [Ignavibacteria bacterium RIFOXYC12_FULL_35_11]OGU94525.1 MAG: 2-alkenal reductase [I
MNLYNKRLISTLALLAFSFFITQTMSCNSDQNRNEAEVVYKNAAYQDKSKLNDEISKSRKNILTETVKNVSPAVVGINVTQIRQYQDPFSSFFDDPFFRQFFGNRGSYSQKVKGLGSGFIISDDGYILTNDHVAGNATEVTVTMTNGKHYKAKIIGSDPVTDICLLKIDENNLPYIEFGNSNEVIIGEWVIALGNPFGLFEINDKPTVTVGVISATGMNLEPINNRYYLNMIQTDAAINGGNSGGPLVNSLGEVIGMNTLIFTGGSGAQGSIGLGFAIPINKVKRIINELKDKGKIDRDFDIGLRIQSLDETIANYYKLSDTRGVIITQVLPKSPASQSGLKVGDIILQIDDYKINNEQTIVGVFQEFRTGQTISLKILRDNEELIKKMTLGK